MAEAFDAQFITISAVLGGVKDIRDAVELARQGREGLAPRATIVFVDEVHRFNKSQQDAFFPHVESGLFTFIGATTENPSFEVNSALLSRATVYVLQPLSGADLQQIVAKAHAIKAVPAIEDIAVERLLSYADGDARRLLNTLETLAVAAARERLGAITDAWLLKVLGQQLRRYDKGGEQFYDTISALHKSVRGSDPDAALYWLVRMLDGGVDPRYVVRRLIRMASEDVGLADPTALPTAVAAAQAVQLIGLPEARLNLAQATIALAVAPKSNAVITAIDAANADLAAGRIGPVPAHLRDAHYAGAATLGHGEGYRYAHSYPHGVVEQQYPPDPVVGRDYYQPSDNGAERDLGERLTRLRRAVRGRSGEAGG
jgi:putative ATPase